jgi:choline kinase
MCSVPAVRQTVILAAGTGTRLGSAQPGVPKPLLTVAGVPLIGHALAHAQASGCVEAIVVIGHESARVRAAVEALGSPLGVRFVRNSYPISPNGESLLVAEPCVDDRFFLQMVDHLFAEPVLSRLSAEPLPDDVAGRVLVDRAPIGLDLSDATRVRLEGDRVTAIGKGLDSWDAIDAGCFVLTRQIFEALRAVPATESRTVSSAMRQLVGRRALGATEIDGIGWIDVDTPDDREAAEQKFAALIASTATEP